MADYAKIIITGNLGRDPEERYTPAGKMFAVFSVAVNRTYTAETGAQAKETLWYRVTAWGRLAEVVIKYLHKRNKILVDGRLRAPYAFIGKDGKPGASLEMTAENITFLVVPAEGEAVPESVEDWDGNEPPF